VTVALVGARIFDGERMLDEHAAVLEGSRIAALLPATELRSGIEVQQVRGLLAPGFVDVQVNGGGGVLFNDRPTVEGIRAIGAAHRRFGTTGFLPTLITDTRERMAQAIEAARRGMAEGVSGLLGIHLEGPFLNPERKGAHEAHLIRPVEEEDLALIASLGTGATLVTLAPEMVPPETIARLVDAGAIVCAGHTNADYATAAEAARRGLRGFTHLFNAMPPLAGRAPGPVGAALDLSETWASLIVDLVHVEAPALRIALAAKRDDRTMLITDAMSSVGSEADSFELQGRTIIRRDGRLTLADGTLAGSDLDMASAVRNAVSIGVDLPRALRMASRVPAEFLGLGDELGRIAPKRRADLVLLDDALVVRATWIGGARQNVS
jgi:N-acetylglucosamine-6-phosphate deacetylase